MAKKAEGTATFESVISGLKAKNYSSVYFLQGEEPYYIDKISQYIEEHILTETEKSFNQTIFYGKETDINTVISAAKRFPMMCDKQVVIVKEAQEMASIEKGISIGKGSKAQELNLLENYVKNPLETTILVFCFKYKKLDGRKSLATTIAKNGILYESKKIYDNQLPAWIKNNIEQRGLKITDKAIYLLAESVGVNLSRLDNEIDKMLISLKAGGTITDTLVQDMIGVSKEYNVYELQKALGLRNIVQSNKIVHYMSLSAKTNPIQLSVVALFAYFMDLFLLRMSSKATQPMSDSLAAQLIGKSPFFVKEYISASQKYSPGKLVNILSYLRIADLQSKGVDATADNMNDGAILKELVFKILN